MEVLKFIFILGINFSIFGFIWGIIMFVIKSLQAPGVPKKQSTEYIFRIIKYFLLVSVTANFIVVYEMGQAGRQLDITHIIIGSAVLGLYLLGKFQNRSAMNQIAKNPMFSKFMPQIDPKVELFLLLGSVAYFVVCLIQPQMVNNGLINWFTSAINSIYETPVIGWIFQIIAFFFLISILFRAANVIGRILNGQPILNPPNAGGSFEFHAGGTQFEENEDVFESDQDEDGFSDYEDVTEEDEESKS